MRCDGGGNTPQSLVNGTATEIQSPCCSLTRNDGCGHRSSAVVPTGCPPLITASPWTLLTSGPTPPPRRTPRHRATRPGHPGCASRERRMPGTDRSSGRRLRLGHVEETVHTDGKLPVVIVGKRSASSCSRPALPKRTTDNSRRVAHGRPAILLLSTALSAVGLLIRRPEVRILPGAPLWCRETFRTDVA